MDFFILLFVFGVALLLVGKVNQLAENSILEEPKECKPHKWVYDTETDEMHCSKCQMRPGIDRNE